MSYKELFSAIECNRIVIIEDDFKQGEYKKERALYDITMNCFFWIWRQACGAGNCWRCNGTTSILKRASSRSVSRSASFGARS